jgi:replicative DNA helicase
LKIPVILLWQVNRDAHKERRKPRLSDLKSSGALEQDADIVLFVHRPEVYGTYPDYDGQSWFIIAKNRDGKLGEVELRFNGDYQRFEQLEHITGTQYPEVKPQPKIQKPDYDDGIPF